VAVVVDIAIALKEARLPAKSGSIRRRLSIKRTKPDVPPCSEARSDSFVIAGGQHGKGRRANKVHYAFFHMVAQFITRAGHGQSECLLKAVGWF